MSEQTLASSVMGAPRLWAPQLEPRQPPRRPISARGGGCGQRGPGLKSWHRKPKPCFLEKAQSYTHTDTQTHSHTNTHTHTGQGCLSTSVLGLPVHRVPLSQPWPPPAPPSLDALIASKPPSGTIQRPSRGFRSRFERREKGRCSEPASQSLFSPSGNTLIHSDY